MDPDRTARPLPRYLIAVQNLVVAEDIAGTIAELYPEACILSARTLEEAEEVVGNSGGVGIAIVEIRAPELGSSRTGGLLTDCGARIIYLSDPPDGAARDANIFLRKPFTTEDLVVALRSVQTGPGGPA